MESATRSRDRRGPARTGADFVVVDLQHGPVTEADLPGVDTAITAAGSVPLVRTRSPLFADVGRPLDLGPAASSCPMCATPTTRGRSSPPAVPPTGTSPGVPRST